MIKITESTDYKLIRSIIVDPKLFPVVSGTSDNRHGFMVDKSYRYLLATQDSVPVGLVQIKEMTKTLLDVHIFTIPAYWGTKIPEEIVTEGHKWIKEQGYLKTFTKVPGVCTHVLGFLERVGYKCCGMIEKGIVWNQTLCSLFFYEFEV